MAGHSTFSSKFTPILTSVRVLKFRDTGQPNHHWFVKNWPLHKIFFRRCRRMSTWDNIEADIQTDQVQTNSILFMPFGFRHLKYYIYYCPQLEASSPPKAIIKNRLRQGCPKLFYPTCHSHFLLPSNAFWGYKRTVLLIQRMRSLTP